MEIVKLIIGILLVIAGYAMIRFGLAAYQLSQSI